MEEKLTITQVLEITVGMLEEIEVPMKCMDSIGVPVARAIMNLKACINSQKPQESPEETDGEKDA